MIAVIVKHIPKNIYNRLFRNGLLRTLKNISPKNRKAAMQIIIV